MKSIAQPLFTQGDVDGFFGLALDNLVQLLLIDALCRCVLGFPLALVYGRVLPGAAVSIAGRQPLLRVAGAAARGRQRAQRRLRAAVRHQHGLALRARVPGHAAGEARRAGAPAPADPARIAWQAGLAAVPSARASSSWSARSSPSASARSTPRAALLSTLAGIALGFIALGFLFRTFAAPLVGLLTLGVMLTTYFRRVRFRARSRRRLGAGRSAAPRRGCCGVRQPSPVSAAHLRRRSHRRHLLPVPVVGDLRRRPRRIRCCAVSVGHRADGPLQRARARCRTSSRPKRPATRYPTLPSLAVNGIGSDRRGAASARASRPRSTSAIPGWKALGARAGYSVLNGAFFTVIALAGHAR